MKKDEECEKIPDVVFEVLFRRRDIEDCIYLLCNWNIRLADRCAATKVTISLTRSGSSNNQGGGPFFVVDEGVLLTLFDTEVAFIFCL